MQKQEFVVRYNFDFNNSKISLRASYEEKLIAKNWQVEQILIFHTNSNFQRLTNLLAQSVERVRFEARSHFYSLNESYLYYKQRRKCKFKLKILFIAKFLTVNFCAFVPRPWRSLLVYRRKLQDCCTNKCTSNCQSQSLYTHQSIKYYFILYEQIQQLNISYITNTVMENKAHIQCASLL